MDTAIIDQDFMLAQSLKTELNRVTAEQVELHEEIQRQKAITLAEQVCLRAIPFPGPDPVKNFLRKILRYAGI